MEDSQRKFMLKGSQAKAIFLCREVVEEQTLAGHFWELRSSVLHVVSSTGF
jgi:hypothetical protein